jgi:hypothetical protein
MKTAMFTISLLGFFSLFSTALADQIFPKNYADNFDQFEAVQTLPSEFHGIFCLEYLINWNLIRLTKLANPIEEFQSLGYFFGVANIAQDLCRKRFTDYDDSAQLQPFKERLIREYDRLELEHGIHLGLDRGVAPEFEVFLDLLEEQQQ